MSEWAKVGEKWRCGEGRKETNFGDRRRLCMIIIVLLCCVSWDHQLAPQSLHWPPVLPTKIVVKSQTLRQSPGTALCRVRCSRSKQILIPAQTSASLFLLLVTVNVATYQGAGQEDRPGAPHAPQVRPMRRCVLRSRVLVADREGRASNP